VNKGFDSLTGCHVPLVEWYNVASTRQKQRFDSSREHQLIKEYTVSDVRRYVVAKSERLEDKPIQAIKALRLTFGLGLREAKEKNDEIGRAGKSMLMTGEQVCQMVEAGFTVFGNTHRKVSVYRQPDDRKIQAIKDLRNASGYGLKEAKDVIDEMWSYNKAVDIGIINEYTVTVLREKGFTVIGWVDNHFEQENDLFVI
jgi:ribosomal protein L7/L12